MACNCKYWLIIIKVRQYRSAANRDMTYLDDRRGFLGSGSEKSNTRFRDRGNNVGPCFFSPSWKWQLQSRECSFGSLSCLLHAENSNTRIIISQRKIIPFCGFLAAVKLSQLLIMPRDSRVVQRVLEQSLTGTFEPKHLARVPCGMTVESERTDSFRARSGDCIPQQNTEACFNFWSKAEER